VVDTTAPAAVATTMKLMMVLATTPIFLTLPVRPFLLILMDVAQEKERCFLTRIIAYL
jgi:hypothetical protein